MTKLTAPLRLSGEQFEEAQQAILRAFPDYDTLKQCLWFRMNVRADHFVRQLVNYSKQIVDVLEWAEAEDRLQELIEALRNYKPSSVALNELVEALGIEPDPVEVKKLEKIVFADGEHFQDTDAWRQAMIRAEGSVCRVENPEGRACGSGFLIGPNLVMTNHHVKDKPYGDFEGSPDSVCFRFGFRKTADGALKGGTLFSLDMSKGKKNWLIRESPTTELDYAIVRLAEKPGEEPVGEFVGALPRGWLPLKKEAINVGDGLFILQHPLGDVLKTANGWLQDRQKGWLEYKVDTEPGSSGAPVFNNQWKLVGLHSRAGKTAVNRGIALEAILDDLPAGVKGLLPRG